MYYTKIGDNRYSEKQIDEIIEVIDDIDPVLAYDLAHSFTWEEDT